MDHFFFGICIIIAGLCLILIGMSCTPILPHPHPNDSSRVVIRASMFPHNTRYPILVNENCNNMINYSFQMIEIYNTEFAIVQDLTFICGNNLNRVISIINSSNIIIRNIIIKGNDECQGIYIKDSSNITIQHIEIDRSKTPIYITGGKSHDIIIELSRFNNSYSSDNLGANIVISYLNDNYYCPWDRVDTTPTNILIRRNVIENGRAQGIYVNGGANIIIEYNTIMNNDKEGICTDFYTVNSIIQYNIIRDNGFRRKQTNADLDRDFVGMFPRLSDGSSPIKLPAISIDSSGQIQVLYNIIKDNAGGGIKMVRAGYQNLLYKNIIENNNFENLFAHFFGIELGSATLDYNDNCLFPLGSFQNIIVENSIYGSHHEGIRLDHISCDNNIKENIIKDYIIHAISNGSECPNDI